MIHQLSVCLSLCLSNCQWAHQTSNPPTCSCCTLSPSACRYDSSSTAASGFQQSTRDGRCDQHLCIFWSLSPWNLSPWKPQTQWCPSDVSVCAVCSWVGLGLDGYPPSSHWQRFWLHCETNEIPHSFKVYQTKKQMKSACNCNLKTSKCFSIRKN